MRRGSHGRRWRFSALALASLVALPWATGAGEAQQGPEAAASRGATRSLAFSATSPAAIGERYPADRRHSPVTASVASRWRALAELREGLHPNVVAKIGASATVNRNFLRCLASSHVDLGGRQDLAETLAFFNQPDGRPGWRNPFRRTSVAAEVGWHAGRAITGTHPPLAQEVRAVDPQYAVILYGTNDIELGRPHSYAANMRRLVEMLEIRGVIPILTTIMPRDDDAGSDRRVALYNAVIRAVAQAHRLPLIDYHRELMPLPNHGLARDGVHPRAYFVDGRPRSCDFGPEGLEHGHNVRNLLTLEALDRVRRVLMEDQPPVEPPPPPLVGQGSFRSPIEAGGLPFSHAADTSLSPFRDRDRYPGCVDTDEGGPEVVYRFRFDQPVEAYFLAAPYLGADVDVHLLRSVPGGEPQCIARGDLYVQERLEPGEYLLAVDTFRDRRGREQAGAYLLAAARTDLPSPANRRPRLADRGDGAGPDEVRRARRRRAARRAARIAGGAAP
ncbi:MAG: SGNH/GDSL hydrolase family protein [Sandaracinaceae bacterium]